MITQSVSTPATFAAGQAWDECVHCAAISSILVLCFPVPGTPGQIPLLTLLCSLVALSYVILLTLAAGVNGVELFCNGCPCGLLLPYYGKLLELASGLGVTAHRTTALVTHSRTTLGRIYAQGFVWV